MGFSGMSDTTRPTLSEINVTPLVDVVLVLLVIFMVTAPILQTGIEVSLPQTASTTAVDPGRQAVITIGRNEELFYRSNPINFNELGARLDEDLSDSTQPIFVRADKDVRWQTMTTVLGEIKASGYQVVQLVTRPVGTPN